MWFGQVPEREIQGIALMEATVSIKVLDGGKSWKIMGLEKTRHIHRVIISPENSDIVYVGAIWSPWTPHPEKGVYKTSDGGETWEIVSPDLTTNDPEKQKYNESGGLTFDVTGAETHTTILAIALSPVKEGVIWVGTDDGNLQLTQDGGKIWERIVDDSKVWGYVLSVEQDPAEPKLMFLGTEYGLYISIDAGANWTKWINGYPTVSTMDIIIHPREYDLVIGTFGRAAYVLDDIRPLWEMAQKGLNIL